jgi:hypothetical protein
LLLLSSHKKCKHNVAGPVLVPLKIKEYILSKKFDVVDERLCLKINWMLPRPTIVRIFIDNIESQTFRPTGMEMIYNRTIHSGEQDLKLYINNSFGIKRIEECSLMGR